jgi:hypothetical protein
MATYTLALTPTLRNLGTEGSLDTSVVNGVSVQRTGYIETVDGTDRKVLELIDGEVFTDVPETLTDYSNGSGGTWING